MPSVPSGLSRSSGSSRSGVARVEGPVARKLLGVVFLGVLALSGWLSYAVFTKAFVDTVPVTLRTSRIGLQMEPLADVKMRGVRVGEVHGFAPAAHGSGAVVELALDPERAAEVPANVTAAILPTTVFGQKYVALRPPKAPAPKPLTAGDVITRTHVPLEVQQALSDLYPLVRAVRPARLSATLNAVSTALEGRGARVGAGLERLDGYLHRLNPHVPRMLEDLRLLDGVAHDYARVLPDLGRLLRHQAVTGSTLLEKERDLRALFAQTARLSGSARDFLETDGGNIVRLGQVSAPTLALLRRYAPEYPCLLRGLVNWTPRAEQSYRDYVFHINVETVPHQPTGYARRDDPKYGAAHGLHGWPTCATLPSPPYSQAHPAPLPWWANEREADDGVAGSHGKY